MPLPQLTPEQRAAALEKAAAARKVRAELREKLKGKGTTVGDVLKQGETDEIIGKMRVSAVLESLPGVHARGVLGRVLPPVMGTLLTLRVGDRASRRVYLSGDTLTGDHVDLISRRHPYIDVAVVHLGGTRVLAHTVTMDARQGVDFVRRCSPGTVVPVHHDDYRVFRSPLSDFQREMAAVGWGDRLQVVERGDSVVLP